MIRRDFINRKLSLIQDDLRKLTEFRKFSFKEIKEDFIKQAAVERLLERIISRALDINQHLIAELATSDTSPPKDYRQTFLRLVDFKIYPGKFAEEISKSAGTRNILVHEYDAVDYSLIYASIADCLKHYHRYCDYLVRFLKKPPKV